MAATPAPSVPRPARLRGLDDSGATLVEFALVAPFLVILVLGTIEFGLAWRARLDVESAVSLGVRQNANLGNARASDYESLQSLVGTIDNPNLTITKVVIYKATGVEGEPSNPSCLTANPSSTGAGRGGACNVYGPDQLADLGATYSVHFGNATTCTSGSAWDRWWCPVSRKADQGDPPDYLGISIEAELDATTNLFGDSFTITERGVMRLEPDPE